jgi:hypothetical protein
MRIALALVVLSIVLAGAFVGIDADGDGVSTIEELKRGTGLLDADTDGDSLSDGDELNRGTDPLNTDSDADGIDDAVEIREVATDPTTADTDADGLDDGRELSAGTNPTDRDTEGDGLTDGREVALGTDPSNGDTDADGLGDAEEVRTYETDPTRADSDGDSLTDPNELRTFETDPTVADTDGDALDDGTELNTYGTDPLKTDTDQDGLGDGTEVNTHESTPTDADTDGDGLEDGPEVTTHRTNPNRADTDGDSLSDGDEVTAYGTSPTDADSDTDGLGDGGKLTANTDPTNPDTDGDGLKDGVEVTDTNVLGTTDPLRTDIFVEIDYMPDMKLPQSDVNDLIRAFDDAPVSNPGGESGINLHIFTGNSALAYEQETTAREYYNQGILAEEFDSKGWGFWHIALVDTVNAEDKSDSVVGLYQRGTSGMIVESRTNGRTGATLMHELGHALGLSPDRFVGIDSTEVSGENYPSVMNYNGVPVCQDVLFLFETCTPDTSYYDYSDGTNSATDHDDWGYLEDNMRTPSTTRLDRVHAPD